MRLADWTPEAMPLPRLAFFVGPNGAGKSWLLERAVRLAKEADPGLTPFRVPLVLAGVWRFTTLQTAIEKGQASLFVIEGIDQGLHLRLQYELVEFCQLAVQSNPNLRVWTTCYSPFALESVPHESVFVFAQDKEGERHVQPLTACPRFDRWGPFFTAGELWANTGEDWVFAQQPAAEAVAEVASCDV